MGIFALRSATMDSRVPLHASRCGLICSQKTRRVGPCNSPSSETQMSFNLFPGYLIALRVPLYDNAVSTVTPVEPQPTATDMNREGFSLDLFLEMHRVYDVDQVFLVTHRCDDGGARLEVSKVEEGELVWTGTNDYIPPEILNDQFFTIVDDSTVVID
jgi:hypothetical protein